MSDVDPFVAFTPQEVASVSSAWEIIRAHMPKCGLDIFIDLFGAYPEHQQLFSSVANVKLDRMRASSQLVRHTDAVMLTLTAVVDNLASEQSLRTLLTRLGGIHVRNHVPSQAFKNFNAVLVHWLRQQLGGRAKPTTLAAVEKMLGMVAAFIHAGMAHERQAGIAVDAVLARPGAAIAGPDKQ